MFSFHSSVSEMAQNFAINATAKGILANKIQLVAEDLPFQVVDCYSLPLVSIFPIVKLNVRKKCHCRWDFG